MRGRLAVITAVSVLLSGCAGSSQLPTFDPPQGAEAALNLWKGFPAAASPRPLVLAGPAIIDPPSGFRNGADKLAYIYGQFMVAGTLPGGSPTWHQQLLITAARALADLRSSAPSGSSTGTTLTITGARLGTATFATDRGQRSLPAWQFRFAGVRDVASVLAIAPANRWPTRSRPIADISDLTARIAPGGDSITIMFIGGPAEAGPCQENYQADTVQSDSAVLVAIRELPAAADQPVSSDGIAIACNLFGYQRSVTVKLSPVLGGRVLIDSSGVPLPVR